jgi:hypothetical protein
MRCNCNSSLVRDGYEIYCPICFNHVGYDDLHIFNNIDLRTPKNYESDVVFELQGLAESWMYMQSKRSTKSREKRIFREND